MLKVNVDRNMNPISLRENKHIYESIIINNTTTMFNTSFEL